MSRILIFETTGSRLYGAVASRRMGGSVACSAASVSEAADFSTAVGEVLEQLRADTGGRLPKKAALITPSAVSQLLFLPVDPKKPRPPAQMKELVRWEFEEVFAQQSDIWSLGALLQGKGYVSAQQRCELETEVVAGGRRSSSVGAYRDAVTREQFDECLAVQETLTTLDDELVLGWNPQRSDADEQGQFAWYCAGIGEELRSQWSDAFASQGVTCTWIYPQLGTGLPLLNTKQEAALLVDVRQEQFGLFQGVGGLLDSVSIGSCPQGTASPESVAAAASKFIHPDTRAVYVSASQECLEPMLAELQQALGECQVTALSAQQHKSNRKAGRAVAHWGCPEPVQVSLEGAARHALRQCASDVLVRVEAQPPKPPFWKSAAFWPWAIIGLLVVGAATIEISMRWRTHQNELDLNSLDVEYERRLRVLNEARSMQGSAANLKKTLTEKERELEEKLQRLELLDNVIGHRQELVPGLLRAIKDAVTAEVVLDLLEENKDGTGFYLEGWTLTDTEGQRFGKRLNKELAPWGYQVREFELSRGKGRLGLEGFILKCQLTKSNTTGQETAEDNDD